MALNDNIGSSASNVLLIVLKPIIVEKLERKIRMHLKLRDFERTQKDIDLRSIILEHEAFNFFSLAFKVLFSLTNEILSSKMASFE